MKNLSPEVELLLCCARIYLDAEKISKINALLKQNINWEYLISTARLNKILPLLYWHLNSICPEAVPETYLNYLKYYFLKNSQSNLYLTRELHRLLNLFNANGIPVLPYKGPTLASSVYGNLALRVFSDLDILVHKEDFLKIKNLLLSNGYYSEHQMSTSQEKAYLKYYCDYSFDRDDDIYLEIHWDILHNYFSFPFDTKYFWERSKRIVLGSETVSTLSPEILLIVLCTHGAKNCWEMMGWICDVAELINANENLDWDWVVKQTEKLYIKRILFLGLFLANDLLGANIPKEVLEEVQREHIFKKIASNIYVWLFEPDKGGLGLFDTVLFQLKVRERLLDKILYFFRFVLTPSFGDWQFVQLPEPMFFIYYLIRPFRLIGKYIFRLFGGKSLSKYEKTPIEVIDKMLELSRVKPGDVVYDLGSGDGRIVIRAAKNYGIQCVGVDSNPQRIAESKINAKKAGVEKLVRFIQQDAMSTDFSSATVVTCFLNLSVSHKVGLLLQKQLHAGARVVSHCSYIQKWTPTETILFPDKSGSIHTLYLWTIDKPITNTACETEHKLLSSITKQKLLTSK